MEKEAKARMRTSTRNPILPKRLQSHRPASRVAEPHSGVRPEEDAASVESRRPGPHSPAAQPTPDPHGCGGTGAAGRASVPSSLGRVTGPGIQEAAAEQHQLRPAVRADGCINLRSLWVQQKADANNDLEIPKLKMELLENQERIHTAQRSKATEQQQKRDLQKRRLLWQKQDLEKRRLLWQKQDLEKRRLQWKKEGLEKRQLQQKEGQEQRFSQMSSSQIPERPRRVCYEKLYPYVTEVVHIEYMKDVIERLEDRKRQAGSAGGIAQTVLEDKAVALGQEEKREDPSNKELCQGDGTVTRVSPIAPKLSHEPHDGSQERASCPSTMGTGATGEEAADQREVSCASTGLMDSEPAASAPSGAPEEEEHHAPLGPVEREEAKAPDSPDLAEADKAGETESKSPTPHSPPDDDPALLDAAQVLVRKVLCRVLVELPCRAHQQPQEPKMDLAQMRDETTTASPPAASQETESALPAEPQEEASTAPLIPAAALEDRPSMATPVAADHQAQASTENVTLTLHKEQVASPSLQSPLSHPRTPHLHPDDEGDARDPSGCPGNPEHGVDYRTSGDSQPSPRSRDISEDDPGITPLLHPPAQRQQPSRFRSMLRALRRAFRRCTCMAGV